MESLETGKSHELLGSVTVETVRQLNQLRERVRSQERRIQDWIDDQIPEELFAVPNVATCAGSLVRHGGAGFMISKDMITKYLDGHETVRTLLAQLQEKLQSIVTIKIKEDPHFKDLEVRLLLKQ